MPIAPSKAPDSQRSPIFIVGAPRSGTSMLHWALVQHKSLWGSAESDFLSTLIEGAETAFASGTKFGEFHWLIKERVSKSEFFQHVGNAVESLYFSRSGGLRWVDQTPHYVLHYSGLSAMFPGAKFIHIVRDGRQVINSMQEKFGWSFAKAMHQWKQLVEAGDTINRQNKGNFLQIKYESILLNPEKMFHMIFEFIEEDFDSKSVGFLEKPINTTNNRETESSTDKLIPRWNTWKLYRHLIFRLYCGQMMKNLGYQVDT